MPDAPRLSNQTLSAFFRSKYTRILTAVLVLQAALFYSASHGDAVPLIAPLSAFPTSVGNWHMAQEGVIEKETLDILRADDTLTRWYVGPIGGANLFIAYFKTQRQGQSPHSPKNCLPGSGWQPSETGKVNVDAGGETIRINRYIVAKGDEKSMVLYWYETQGRVIADEFAAKFYLIADSIRKHRSDTALVRVVVPIGKDRDADAQRLATNFVQTFYPAVRSYLPQ